MRSLLAFWMGGACAPPFNVFYEIINLNSPIRISSSMDSPVRVSVSLDSPIAMGADV